MTTKTKSTIECLGVKYQFISASTAKKLLDKNKSVYVVLDYEEPERIFDNYSWLKGVQADAMFAIKL